MCGRYIDIVTNELDHYFLYHSITPSVMIVLDTIAHHYRCTDKRHILHTVGKSFNYLKSILNRGSSHAIEDATAVSNETDCIERVWQLDFVCQDSH